MLRSFIRKFLLVVVSSDTCAYTCTPTVHGGHRGRINKQARPPVPELLDAAPLQPESVQGADGVALLRDVLQALVWVQPHAHMLARRVTEISAAVEAAL